MDIYLFCQVLGEKEHEEANRNEYNFDHPDAFDFELLIKTLRRLKSGKKVDVPIYNFVTHSRESQAVSRMIFLSICHCLALYLTSPRFRNLEKEVFC